LVSEVFSLLGDVIGIEGSAALPALGREDLLDPSDVFNGNELSPVPLVAGLPPSIPLPRFLRRSWLGPADRAIGGRRLGRSGGISGQQRDLAFQFGYSGLKSSYCGNQLHDEVDRCFGISIYQCCGVFPGHGGEPKPVSEILSSGSKKTTRYRANTESPKDRITLNRTPPGGITVNYYGISSLDVFSMR
jgi:hypothetical protein